MKKCGLMLILLMMLILPVMPSTQAQDDDLALIEYVSDSFENLLQMSSIYTSGTQVLNTELSAQGETFVQSNTNEITIRTVLEDAQAVAVDIIMMQSVIGTDNADQNLDFTFSSDMRLVDEVVYMRFYNAPLELNGYFPEGWVTLNEDSDEYPALRSFDPDLMTSLIGNIGLRAHYNSETILSIEELPEETLENGTPTRVFSVIVDATVAFQGDTAEYLMNSLSLTSFGVDFEKFVANILPITTYSATIWIDTTTDIVTQVETTMNFDAEVDLTADIPVNLTEEISTFYRYSRFNETVEITAPDLDE